MAKKKQTHAHTRAQAIQEIAALLRSDGGATTDECARLLKIAAGHDDDGAPISLNQLFAADDPCPFLGDDLPDLSPSDLAAINTRKPAQRVPLTLAEFVESAGTDGTLEMRSGVMIAVMTFGGEFVRWREEAARLLELVDEPAKKLFDTQQLADYLRANPLDPGTVAVLIGLARRGARASNASSAASRKNAEARAWVRDRWVNRADCGQSKAAFSRDCVGLVKREFRVRVTADRIARYWLR